jgi:hypothetical protein
MRETHETRPWGAGLGEASFPGGNDNRVDSPSSLVAQIKIAPLQQDFAYVLSRATAACCILGVDPGISAAIAFYFPSATDRVTWEKHFRLPADNEASRALALRTFSGTSQHSARKKDHGRAEATLLALYGAFLERSRA